MKNVDIFAIKGVTKKDDRKIIATNAKGIGMTIDEFGMIYNEGGQYIANATEVESGFGIGCNYHGGKREGSGRPQLEDPRRARSIKFTDAEWDRLKQEASRQGVTVSEYVRNKVL